MKNTFLAIHPNEESINKIKKVVGEVGRVFEGEQISVRWVKPENICIEILDFGEIGLIKKMLLMLRLKKETYPHFTIGLGECQLGKNRKYKDLVYLTIDNGADELRNIVFKFKSKFKTKEISLFIPLISIGRVNKDLTPQEFTNLLTDIRNINKSLNIKSIKFDVEDFRLVERVESSLKTISIFK